MDSKRSLDTYKALDLKFKENFKLALEQHNNELTRVEVKARSFAIFGEILASKRPLDEHQQEITKIFNELFADLSAAIYFGGCSLTNPGKVQLRRVLELGISIIYLWDTPSRFWGWEKHDNDLKFQEMLDYLSDSGFKTYVQKINPRYDGSDILDFRIARILYRDLSNIVHGKISTFKSNSTESFNFNSTTWREFLYMAETVENLLLDLWSKRFPNEVDELYKKVPSLIMSKG